MGIVLARIDNRLLHGIVATQWAGRSGAQRIMIIDDTVANNELTKASMKLARPTGMAISIITEEAALNNFKAGKYNDHTVFVLVKRPETLVKLSEIGVNPRTGHWRNCKTCGRRRSCKTFPESLRKAG